MRNLFYYQCQARAQVISKSQIQALFGISKGGGQKKSCNIVTTPVHLPTYPYCCKEGNFLILSPAYRRTLETGVLVTDDDDLTH